MSDTGRSGPVFFAGVMLLLLGGFQAIEGLVAAVRADYYLVTPDRLLLTMGLAAWGWTHLVIGLIATAAGIGVLLGQGWARVTGILVAVLSALANLAFLPAYPIWCTIVIAMAVLVIYGLAAHGRTGSDRSRAN